MQRQATYGFLAAEPTARIVAPGKMEVVVATVAPTPPMILYSGVNTLEEELDLPRYRWTLREAGAVTDLRTEHRVVADFGSYLRSIPNTPYEPRICWRAELYLPAKRSSRFVEGRAYFDPETLGDTVNVLYGPIVDQVSESGAVISFETDRPALCSVQVGPVVVVEARAARRHEVEISGLKAATTYTYRVRAGRTTVRPYTFRTPGGDRFAFAAMVDSREGVGGGMRNFGGVEGRALQSLTSHAYYQGADFILFAGDLINGYTTSVVDYRMQLRSFRQLVGPVHARIPIYEGMGNHEALIDLYVVSLTAALMADKSGASSGEAVFADTFVNPRNGPENEGPGSPTYGENVYRFDHGNARFLVLNNNYWWCSDPFVHGGNLEGFILPVQMQWLREQVAAADADPAIRHLFFAAQEPPFPNGGHTLDAMWYRGGDTNRDGKVGAGDIDIVGNRNTLWEIVAGSPKTVAFITGDEHAYSRLLVRPETPVGHRRNLEGREVSFRHAIWQVTSGGAGAPWYDKELSLPWSGDLKVHSTQPHYALFRIDGEKVTLEVYAQTGQKIDAAVLR